MTGSAKKRQRLQPGRTRAPRHSLDRLVRRLETRLADWKQLEYVRRRERNHLRRECEKLRKVIHWLHIRQARIYNVTAATLWPAQEQRQADSPNTQAEARRDPSVNTIRDTPEPLPPAHCSAPMRFAYADPPYLGQGRKHYANLHADAGDCDTLEWHAALIRRLTDEYPQGWALSASSVTLRTLLPLCPEDVRVGAWVKPFCSFKPGVNPAYAWEPVIFRGGRKRDRWEDKVRDYAAVPITLRMGFPGAKPEAFVRWVLDLLNAHKEDEVNDLFPGSGAVTRAIEAWRSERLLWEQNVKLTDGGPP